MPTGEPIMTSLSEKPPRAQFGAFDGLDNRRTVMDLFQRLGGNEPEHLKRARRAGFLTGLISLSDNGFGGLLSATRITPCSAGEAYFLFVAICGVLGVPIEEAAKLLEEVVRNT